MESPPAIVMPPAEVPPAGRDGEGPQRPSLVIVPPRKACGASDPDEVVICGRRDDSRYRVAPLPPNPTLMDEANDKLSGKIGPVEVGSLRQADGTRQIGFRIRF